MTTPTPTTRQSAIEAIDVLLTANQPAETLRVSRTGRVYKAHALTVFFERAGDAIARLLRISTRPTDREDAARKAVLHILSRDVRLLTGSASPEETRRLDQLLTNISEPSPRATRVDWRTCLSTKINALSDLEETRTLASALSKLEFYARPVNAPLLPSLREALANKASYADALKSALRSHLVAGLGMPAETARNASNNIFWAMTNFDCDFKEAFDIACCAGRMVNQKACPMQQDTAMSLAWMRVKHNATVEEAKAILDSIDQRISELCPEGWPDTWEATPDGSRRLKDSEAFGQEFLKYLKGSSTEGSINEAGGLSSKYLDDAGRSRFRFGRGPTAVVAELNKEKAIKALTDNVPDAAVRKTLSRCLFQSGLNGLVSSMNKLKTRNGSNLWMDPIYPDNEKAKTTPFSKMWIDTGEDGKIRVGYSLYANHFCLSPPHSDQKVKINSRYDSNEAASVARHTGKLRALVEFDVEQLRQGVIEPRLVRDPVVQLTIEPDRARIAQALFEHLRQQRREREDNHRPA